MKSTLHLVAIATLATLTSSTAFAAPPKSAPRSQQTQQFQQTQPSQQAQQTQSQSQGSNPFAGGDVFMRLDIVRSSLGMTVTTGDQPVDIGGEGPSFLIGYAFDRFMFGAGINLAMIFPKGDGDTTIGFGLEPTVRYYFDQPNRQGLSTFGEGSIIINAGSEAVPTVLGLAGALGVVYQLGLGFGVSGQAGLALTNIEDAGTILGVVSKGSIEYRF